MTAAASTFLGRGRRGLWIGLAVFAASLIFGWVGFIASDDATYAVGAYGWIESFPYVGGHGTIRYPITIPIALSFLTLGQNEFAMVLPSLLYLLVFLITAWRVCRDVAGATSAFFALLLVVTNPLIAVQASIPNVDVVEMSLLFGAWILCFRCLDQGGSRWRLLGAGALAGIAFLTRETAIFIAPFFGLLFLAGHRIGRWPYLWVAAGFLAVWALELAYLGVMTGDPFYRFNISLNHDSSIDRTIDLAGNVIVHPLLDPFLLLMINQEFMLLMFAAIPLSLWLCFAGAVPDRVRHFARLLALFGLCWFLCVGAAQTLLPLNPRYFMITSTAACLLTGLALGQLIDHGRPLWRRGALAITLLLVATNFLGIEVENRHPDFGEEKLIAALQDHPQAVIATDAETRFRADISLRWAGAQHRVVDTLPSIGSLYYFNPARLGDRADGANAPQPGWQRIATFESEPTRIARVIETLGMAQFVPPAIWRKLRYPQQPTYLYRVR